MKDRWRFDPGQPRDAHGRWRLTTFGREVLWLGGDPKNLSDVQLLTALNEAENLPEVQHTLHTKRQQKRLRIEARRRGLTPESGGMSHLPGMPRSPLSRTPNVEPPPRYRAPKRSTGTRIPNWQI